MESNKKPGRTPTETKRLKKAVENFHNLTHGTDRVKDLPEIQMTEEEVRYLEQYGTLPESSSPIPLRKAS